jgi:protein required for attachment to host cells
MKRELVRQGDWIVVCDGRKALILENQGDEKYPNLRKREVRQQQEVPTRELGSDRPGRVHESVGAARSAMEQADLHEDMERAFIANLADHLHTVVRAHPERRLIIVAPPRALANLRNASSAAVRNSIAVELDKDWVNEPIEKIERHLFS